MRKLIISALLVCLYALWSPTAAAKLGVSSVPAQLCEVRDMGALCEIAAKRAERRHRLPGGWLVAISLKETGRWNKTTRRSHAWPWTVTAKGAGHYLASKRAAIDAVWRLQAQGVKNIDVGCMQINLRYHPKAFTDLHRAFDPRANTDYAAAFLDRLHRTHGHWSRTLEHYHSSDPQRGRRYREAVTKLRLQMSAIHTAKLTTDTKRGFNQLSRDQMRKQVDRARVTRRRNIDQLRRQRAEQRMQCRAEFELRKAKVFAGWTEMMRGRSNRGQSDSGV